MHAAEAGNPLQALVLATLYNATPLMIAAMGGILSERAGVVNIALEGLMLAGAYAGIAFGAGSGMVGLGAAVAVGAALGCFHALLTQGARINHIISGLGINMLAAGATQFLFHRMAQRGTHIAGLPNQLFLAIAILAPIAVWLVLAHTRFGLRLRACGEDPESARMSGIDPFGVRLAAVTASGALAGLAGAYLSMAEAHTFTTDMSAGKGYIALAAVIFGKWKPLGAAAGALFFGLFYAVETQLQISGAHIVWMGVDLRSPFIMDAVPYVTALIALVTVVGRATAPAALGKDEGS
jgi:simple sugar transport system permease protein